MPALSKMLILTLLAAFPAQVSATIFEIPCTGTVEDEIDFAAAIDFANDEAGFPGPDVLQLGAGCTYQFELPNNYWYGSNALPPIQSVISIEGNGATLVRDVYLPSTASAAFRFFYVSGGLSAELPQGTLTLHALTLANGLALGGSSNGGGGGAGMGGAIFNQGTLALDAVTLTGNRAQGGRSHDGSDHYGGGGMGEDGASGDGGGFGGDLTGGPYGGAGAPAGNSGAGGGGGFTDGSGNATDVNGAGLGELGGAGGDGPLGGSSAGDGGGGGACLSLSHGGGFGKGGQSGGGSCAAGGGVGGGGGSGFVGGGGGFGGGGGSGNSPGSGGFGGGAGSGPFASAQAGFGGSNGGAGAGLGGAIFNDRSSLDLVNVTIANNVAAGGTGSAGQRASGLGAALFNLNGTVSIAYSTVAWNEVDGNNGLDDGAGAGGGAVYSLAFGSKIEDGTASTAALITSNSIVFGTVAAHGAAASDIINNKVAGTNAANSGNQATLLFAATNLVGGLNNLDMLDPASTVPLATDPHLGVLGSNGAPNAAFTISIDSNSPAFNAAVDDCPNTDARGTLRPQFGQCDVGAYEYSTVDDVIFAAGFE
jgi:hypothetical protein